MQAPISVFIICQDEEAKIEACLKQAAQLADEIIIVDSGSTDKTLEIAAKYTDKIFHQDWLGFGKQKNEALNKCTNEWVLSLDADEVLTDDLIEEIKALNLAVTGVKDSEYSLDFPGYQIARKLFIGDKFIRFGGYYPDYQLRLFKKSMGRFCNSPVHESVELLCQGQYSKERVNCPNLCAPLDHFAYNDIQEMEQAFAKYATLSSKKKSKIKAAINGIFTFINKFFLQLGLLHGVLGLRLSWNHSVYSFRKYI